MGYVQYRIEVSGLVQGVFFRANVLQKAIELRLTGWVRNRLNGSVEVLAQGETKQLRELVDFLYTNPGLSRVREVKATEEKAAERLDIFIIRKTE